MTLIKICGVNSPEAFAAVIQAEADYLGFVFFERSPRFVTGLQAAALSEHDHSGPKRVGLFVEPQPAEIRSVLETVKLDVLQVYGSATLCQQLRATFGLPGMARQSASPDSTTYRRMPKAWMASSSRQSPQPAPLALAAMRLQWNWSLLSGWKAPAPWLLGWRLKFKKRRTGVARYAGARR